MGVPLKQIGKISAYIAKQRIKGRRRYPLILMLEPLFRCNLNCPGCGKIQYPVEILRKDLSLEECFRAVDECGAPVVSVAGGEPLLYPQIDRLIQGLLKRKKFVYLCTNAILLREKLDLFRPSVYLTFGIHLDGLEKAHDRSVHRRGVFKEAVGAIQEAKKRGFRVTTNTTVFDGTDPQEIINLFDELTRLKVDGMILSPGYAYESAPDQNRFLKRHGTKELFRKILGPDGRGKKEWTLNHSHLYLEFLVGKHDYDCTPWGSPNYSMLGWQRPCYLMAEGGYAKTFRELMENTDWSRYGSKSGNPRCADCMVHSGYEPSAVTDSMTSLRKSVKSFLTSLGIK